MKIKEFVEQLQQYPQEIEIEVLKYINGNFENFEPELDYYDEENKLYID